MHTIGLVNTNNQMLTDGKRGIPFGKEKTRENTVGIRETDGVCRIFPDPDLICCIFYRFCATVTSLEFRKSMDS